MTSVVNEDNQLASIQEQLSSSSHITDMLLCFAIKSKLQSEASNTIELIKLIRAYHTIRLAELPQSEKDNLSIQIFLDTYYQIRRSAFGSQTKFGVGNRLANHLEQCFNAHIAGHPSLTANIAHAVDFDTKTEKILLKTTFKTNTDETLTNVYKQISLLYEAKHITNLNHLDQLDSLQLTLIALSHSEMSKDVYLYRLKNIMLDYLYAMRMNENPLTSLFAKPPSAMIEKILIEQLHVPIPTINKNSPLPALDDLKPIETTEIKKPAPY